MEYPFLPYRDNPQSVTYQLRTKNRVFSTEEDAEAKNYEIRQDRLYDAGIIDAYGRRIPKVKSKEQKDWEREERNRKREKESALDLMSIATINATIKALRPIEPTEEKIYDTLFAIYQNDHKADLKKILADIPDADWKAMTKKLRKTKGQQSYKDPKLNYLAAIVQYLTVRWMKREKKLLKGGPRSKKIDRREEIEEIICRNIGEYLSDYLHEVAPEEFIVVYVELPKSEFNLSEMKPILHNIVLFQEKDGLDPYRFYIRWNKDPGYFTTLIEGKFDMENLPVEVYDYFLTYFGIPDFVVPYLYRPSQ